DFLGAIFDVTVSAMEPENLGMNAWVSLQTPNGTELVYPMVSTFHEYLRQEFSTRIDTSKLASGNYSMNVYVQNTDGEKDVYGPITLSLRHRVPFIPSPLAVLLASPAFMIGGALTIISMLGAAVWFTFYWKPQIEIPTIPKRPPVTPPPAVPVPPPVPTPVPPSVPPSPLRRSRLQRAAFRVTGLPSVEPVLAPPPAAREPVRPFFEAPARLREELERLPIREESRAVRLQRATLRSLIETPVTPGVESLRMRLPEVAIEEVAERPIRLREEVEAIPGREESRQERIRRAALRIREEEKESDQEDSEETSEA
ncbi:MAG: hypothetical protein JSW01_04750, partial [Candidatus Bathyarchaeota archaeon]